MAGTKSNSSKPGLSSDCKLQFRLHEGGIASNRRSATTAVNMFPGLVHTARHTMEAGSAQRRYRKPSGWGRQMRG